MSTRSDRRSRLQKKTKAQLIDELYGLKGDVDESETAISLDEICAHTGWPKCLSIHAPSPVILVPMLKPKTLMVPLWQRSESQSMTPTARMPPQCGYSPSYGASGPRVVSSITSPRVCKSPLRVPSAMHEELLASRRTSMASIEFTCATAQAAFGIGLPFLVKLVWPVCFAA